ncbi:methylated-DNA--[protein]-cysteine S-methyltransferase [Chitinibacter sp. S2-10]|uniref:methylated-DNA--[protein]-cysteine S-methyltransferase n=1 Tax=Chitinibacter sp. S2-10 TaxID=3373597 RepID=UPI003977A553
MAESIASVCVTLPFGAVQVFASDTELLRLDFLAEPCSPILPRNRVLDEAEQQLLAYAREPHFQFDLPMHLEGTPHQLKVWQHIAAIDAGKTLRYRDIAEQIGSSPRAVGGACGRNPLPIFIPCHRVLAANGLGGFNANRNGLDWMPFKRWLLAHEGVIPRQAA